jgi:hypothetical protein
MRSSFTRRDALRKMAAGGIGAAASAHWVDNLAALARSQAAHLHVAAAAAQSVSGWTPKVLNAHQHETVAALVELIIPETDTPGAKAVFVDRFIDSTLDAAPRPERTSFLNGLAWLDRRSTALYKKVFVGVTPAQQTELLTKLLEDGSTEPRAGIDFFNAIKSMTIAGYYTTEVGLQQELGDDGQLVLPSYVGCTHPEHQG